MAQRRGGLGKAKMLRGSWKLFWETFIVPFQHQSLWHLQTKQAFASNTGVNPLDESLLRLYSSVELIFLFPLSVKKRQNSLRIGTVNLVWTAEEWLWREVGVASPVLEVEVKCAVTQLIEPEQGSEGTPLPIRKFIGSLAPRYVLNYWSDLLFALAELLMLCILNSVLKLEQANPLGTPESLIIIHFCSFPRVSFLHRYGCQPFNKRYSRGLSKRKS